MRILIADGNEKDSDRFSSIIPLALPTAKCYVCSSSDYLQDFLENFRLDYVFFGSYGTAMTVEKLLVVVKEFSKEIHVVHYSASLSKAQIDAYKELGCHAAFERVDDVETAVIRLKELFTKK